MDWSGKETGHFRVETPVRFRARARARARARNDGISASEFRTTSGPLNPVLKHYSGKVFVSVDVDSLHHYIGLYGGSAVENRQDLVRLTYEIGVERFVELFREMGLRACFFVVGQDLETDAARTVASRAAGLGHVLGNHTWSHPYNLIRLSDQAAREEILSGHRAVQGAAGLAPTVFRAPGYNMTTREYRILADLRYRYDASPLPSIPYLLLKYSVMAWLLARGRASRSVWGNPLAFTGTRRPHERAGLQVIPCSVTPWLRLPIIGTALATVPSPLFAHLVRSAARQEFVSIEFHAVDLMEFSGDRLPEALRAQKDLLVPLARKRDRFLRFLDAVLKAHTAFVPE